MTFLFKPKKTILQFYHFTALEPFRKYGIFGTLSWLAEQIALRYNRNFITMADSVAEIIKNKYHKSNVRPTYTGFDEKLLCETPEDKNFILSFGRLDVHMKGLDILIPAFEKISPQFPLHTLIIAGRGTEKDISWIKNRIKESPCADRIDLINGVPYEKKLELFRTATIVAIPSRFEGWCIVAIEAAASSKATVGTKILGLGDAIVDGKTGILVPSEDVNALAEKMKLLLNNATLRNELGKNGYEWAQRFTWDKMAKLQEEFYENTVKGLQ
jgi:glycosyltransferase involved in cell wall biosynthesis